MNKLNNNQSSKNAISHKDLNAFLIKAQKDITSVETFEKNEFKENQDLIDLVSNWTETSKKLLLMLNEKERVFAKNTSPKSLMAYGAMAAHITMALQALKATGSDQ